MSKILFLIAVTLLCGGIYTCGFVLNEVKTEVCKIDHVVSTDWISSMKDNTDIDGHFFLGSGGVSSERVYVAYVKNNDGSYSQKTYPVETTKIFMDTRDNPYVLLKYRYNCNIGFPSPFYYYEFHVPNNTIVKEFKLDGE